MKGFNGSHASNGSSPRAAGAGFPVDFAWGAATSAYQIEGGWEADGRGASIWDTFCRQPGRIMRGDAGDKACDHYGRYREDAAIMEEIGLRAYRFSISWPRVLPSGTGRVNEAGIAFYDRLVDELLARGIDPWVTLYHWDLPYDLFLRGGWLNPEIPRWFAEYASVVVDRLSDRVTNWLTLNEPQCFIDLGYGEGKHAPGLRLGTTEVLLAAHHSLLAHGRAVQAIRAGAKSPAKVGWAPCGMVSYPATERAEDVAAAKRATLGMSGPSLWNNAWWYEPVYRGRYPEEGLQIYGKQLPRFGSGDLEIICQPLDFCAANIYGGTVVEAGPDGETSEPEDAVGAPHLHFPASLSPEGLYWGPRFFHEEYGLPIVITENGMAGSDWIGLDGRVNDSARIDFLHRYLLSLRRAVDEGVEVQGYFVWSIFDNFEWIKGYKFRFGMVHVDYETQRRTLKDSAHWYREVIRSNGESLVSAMKESTVDSRRRRVAELVG